LGHFQQRFKVQMARQTLGQPIERGLDGGVLGQRQSGLPGLNKTTQLMYSADTRLKQSKSQMNIAFSSNSIARAHMGSAATIWPGTGNGDDAMTTPTLKALLLALPFALSIAAAAPSMADSLKPRVFVPVTTNDINGCWTADKALYGAYNLSFCLDHGTGSYAVTGGGLVCQSDIAWHKSGSGYKFTMSRSHCGQGTDWSADSFNCSLQPVTYDNGGYSLKPRVAVPTVPQGGYSLACNYRPAVSGWGWEHFSAYRG
jgi:hypothetical protein